MFLLRVKIDDFILYLKLKLRFLKLIKYKNIVNLFLENKWDIYIMFFYIVICINRIKCLNFL